jgi:uncharacterized protein involved in high-affinity Fe2+ transport
MKKTTSIASLALATLATLTLVTACDKKVNDNQSSKTDKTDKKVVAPEDTAGFEEFPIGDDIELAPLNVAGVYFQPVDMEPAGSALSKEEADMHIEADISALDNDLGYGKGDFVPYLTIKYEIEDKNGNIQSGNFMPMNASDGPHYGTNVKIGEAGKYKIRFIISSPEAQGYLLHVDKETGVEGKYWTEPLVAEWDFDYVPREW